MNIKYIALTTLVLTINSFAGTLSTTQQKKTVQYCLNKQSCHTQKITYPKTGNTAIDQWASNKLKKTLNIKDINTQTLRTLMKKRFHNENPEDLGNCEMEFINNLKLVGQSPSYAVLGEETWEYTCGAHGNGDYTLFVLPKSGKMRPLQLKEIVLPNKMAKLQSLQLAAWKKYLAQDGMSSKKINEYLKEWPFKATDNWQLAKNGLTFQFQSYEIAPYAMGTPKLFISNKDLRGIVKPIILTEVEKYQPNKLKK